MNAEPLPVVGKVAFSARFVPVQMGPGMIGHVAVGMGVAGMQRPGVAAGAAAGRQVVRAAAPMTIVAAHSGVMWAEERIGQVRKPCPPP